MKKEELQNEIADGAARIASTIDQQRTDLVLELECKMEEHHGVLLALGKGLFAPIESLLADVVPHASDHDFAVGYVASIALRLACEDMDNHKS